MALSEAPDVDGGGGGVQPGDTTPPTQSGDWAAIATFAAGHTDSKPVNFSYLDTGTLVDLSGTYTVLSVTTNQIVLSNPAIVNPSWDNIGAPGDATIYASPYLSTSGERWVGPFVCDLDSLDRVFANFVALNGLYGVNKKGKQFSRTETALVEITPIDGDDFPIGGPESFTISLTGSKDNKDPLGSTMRAFPSFVGRCHIRARRISPTDLNKDNQCVDEIRWRDTYGLAPVDVDSFGNVTTVHVRTYATNSALATKERRFNLQATRRLPERVAGSTFAGLVGTDRVDAIMSAIALDPYIGRRSRDQIDFDSIYDTVADIEAYFGSDEAVKFGYTFDDNSLSFEETFQAVATCAFSRAYRQGSLIKLDFERATEDSVLLFNHRNTIPNTQQRAYTFGVADGHDGVELEWTAAKDGAQLIYNIPLDRSATSAFKAEVPGIRSDPLAFWHAWRAWNRIVHQTMTIEQEVTQEGGLVLPGNRALITDLTRSPGFEGEVTGVDGFDLTLSQPTEFAPGVAHTIFVQHVDATVEALPVGPWVPGAGEDEDAYRVTLGSAPRMALAFDPELSARAGYEIVPASDRRSRAVIISERDRNTDFTETIRAINYSFLYYQQDELVLWIDFLRADFTDNGPFERNGTPVGGAVTTADAQRGNVYDGAVGRSVTFPNFVPPVSYTKAAWVMRADLTSAGALLGNAHETFGFAAGAALQAGHDGVQVSAPWPEAGHWHHALAAYDADAGTIELYIDGELVDSDAAPARTLTQLVGFTDTVGLVDDLRLWKRALSPREVIEVYRAGRLYATGGLITEDGLSLTTEDGLSLSLE
jgi:hypothetical protein